MREEMEGKHGVQSVETCMHVLKAMLNGHRGMMLKEIAEAAGMPASKVHRYLVSMVRTDLVEQDTNSSLYDLGPFALNVGLVAADRLDRIQFGLTEIAELCNEINEATALATWTPDGPIVVRWERPRKPISVSVITGTTLNMITTSSGRIFGAYLPPATYQHLITEQVKSPSLPDELRSLSAVEQIFAEIRQIGVAVTDKYHLLPGLASVSAPVFNAQGGITLAVAAVGIQGSLDVSLDGPIIKALKTSAERVSRKLGYKMDNGPKS
ncbi:IclR family transcriptional regulator [Geobacter argillaceus]|nr:IclR family transcriptional regulator [Geobacter argillaceus]